MCSTFSQGKGWKSANHCGGGQSRVTLQKNSHMRRERGKLDLNICSAKQPSKCSFRRSKAVSRLRFSMWISAVSTNFSEWFTRRWKKPSFCRVLYAFQQSDTIIVAGGIHCIIKLTRVSASLFYKGTVTKFLGLPRYTPPNTHWTSMRRPRLYFRRRTCFRRSPL